MEKAYEVTISIVSDWPGVLRYLKWLAKTAEENGPEAMTSAGQAPNGSGYTSKVTELESSK